MLKKRGRSTASKSCVIYSDIHVGSKVAVCSGDVKVADQDNPYKPGPAQKALYQVWQESIDAIEQKPNVLVVNGEPTSNKFNPLVIELTRTRVADPIDLSDDAIAWVATICATRIDWAE